MKHTPGPWQCDDEWDVLKDGELVTLVCGMRRTEEENIANAKLIAAAPELLDALHTLEVAANTADYCYQKRPENFAAALKSLTDAADKARSVLAKVES